MVERWLPVVCYEGFYEVSDQGRVRGVERVVRAGRAVARRQAARVLRQSVKKGYATVSIQREARMRTHSVHRLLMAAFVGPCPPGMEVCHNNGQRLDNRLENLRYDTHSANQRDAVRLGTNFHAAKTHCDHGHEFTPENTRRKSNGARNCRTCQSDRQRARRERAAA